MRTSSASSKPQGFWSRIKNLDRLQGLTVVLVASWSVFSFFKALDTDETEHAHVAWMIGKLGWVPLQNFFQHHTRLYWDFLALYFRWGGDGAEVLYFSRALVCLMALGFAGGLYYFSRRCTANLRSGRLALLTGLLLFVGLCASFPEMFVSRPDALSLVLALWAIGVWVTEGASYSRRRGLDLLAGTLFGASCYASPRVALLLLIYPLLSFRGVGFYEKSLSRYVLLALGALCFFGLYSASHPGEFDYFIFCVQFSALLQKAGTFPIARLFEYYSIRLQFVSVLLLWFIPLALERTLIGKAQKSLRIWLAALLLQLLVALGSSWPHAYVQNLMPFFLCATLMTVWHLPSLSEKQRDRISWPLMVLTLAGGIQMGLILAADFSGKADLVSSVRERRYYLSKLGPGETVMQSYILHPIVALDSSYYGGWLVDGPNRLCSAVSKVSTEVGLPPCDYLMAMKKLPPRLVDGTLAYALADDQEIEAKQIFMRNYRVVGDELQRTVGVRTKVYEKISGP